MHTNGHTEFPVPSDQPGMSLSMLWQCDVAGLLGWVILQALLVPLLPPLTIQYWWCYLAKWGSLWVHQVVTPQWLRPGQCIHREDMGGASDMANSRPLAEDAVSAADEGSPPLGEGVST